MRGDALKHVIAAAAAGIEPTKEEQNKALADAADILFDFLADVKRIADAAEKMTQRVRLEVGGVAMEGDREIVKEMRGSRQD